MGKHASKQETVARLVCPSVVGVVLLLIGQQAGILLL
jgi:hypothetical protein